MLAPDESSPEGRGVQSVVRVAGALEAVVAAEAGGAVERRLEMDTPRGRRVLELHAARVQPAGSRGICLLLVVHDVTDAARTAAMKAEFVANASHELRTPLATIRAAVDSLAAVGPDDREAFAKFLGILDRHVARLEGMTRDLLDLHLVEQAKGRLRPEDVEPHELAAWVEAQLGPAARDKGLTLEVRAEPPGRALRTDRRLLALILQNLLDNAIKFTPAGGRVECELTWRAAALAATVRDTGCGIPRELQDRVFERFFQADTSRSGAGAGRGTGLGLAIVKYAAERLGATVTLASTPDVGTTVTVVVPALPED